MSHVVDRNAVIQRELGSCECPNSPHPVDWVKLRERYSYMDKMGLLDAFNQGVEAMSRYRFLKRVVAWNLVGEDGKPVPITQRTLNDLSEPLVKAIFAEIDKLDDSDEDAEDLPNG